MESIIRQKAKENEEIVRSKEEEIAFLTAEYSQLKAENQQISQELW